MNWPFGKKLEPVAQAYRAACRQRIDKDLDVADSTLVALDAETTGFNVESDRILSLATFSVADREIRVNSGRSWIVYQKVSPVNEAMEVHGILPAETAAGQPEKEALAELLKVVGGSLIVGHHIGFDARMLDVALRRHFRIGLRNRFLDTAALAMQELPAFHRTGYANQPPPSRADVGLAGVPGMVLGLMSAERVRVGWARWLQLGS